MPDILDVVDSTTDRESPKRVPEILFLAHRFPYPPDRGDRIRSWNFLRYLSQRARVSLACVSESPIPSSEMEVIRSTCHRVAIGNIDKRRRWIQACVHWLKGRSLTEGLFWSTSLARTLDYWSDVIAFDQVFVYCSSMLPYTERPGLQSLPRVVDLVDVDSQKWRDYAENADFLRRRIYRSEAHRVERLERASVMGSNAVLLASQAEADLLRSQQSDRKANILGLSNGVDTSYFQPQAASQPVHTYPLKKSSGLRLVFVGVLNYPPNVQGLTWFLQRVWPAVIERLPTATIDIVGKNPAPQVIDFANVPGVRLVGAVDDVRPYLADADVAIAPLKIARGIQNKVLEAMAMAKPVVLTSPAAEGIEAIPDKHFVVADTAEDWLENILALERTPEARRQLGAAARELIENEFEWSSRLEPLDALLGFSKRSDRIEQPSPVG